MELWRRNLYRLLLVQWRGALYEIIHEYFEVLFTFSTFFHKLASFLHNQFSCFCPKSIKQFVISE